MHPRHTVANRSAEPPEHGRRIKDGEHVERLRTGRLDRERERTPHSPPPAGSVLPFAEVEAGRIDPRITLRENTCELCMVRMVRVHWMDSIPSVQDADRGTEPCSDIASGKLECCWWTTDAQWQLWVAYSVQSTVRATR